MDLAADIGATNARFQFCTDGDLCGSPVVLPTAQFADSRALLQAAAAALGAQRPRRALLAVAGPTAAPGGGTADDIEVTNTGLRFSAASCAEILGCATELANDFYVLAHGVPHFTALTQLGGGAVLAGTKALLGPGSGLGMATLAPLHTAGGAAPGAGRWQVLASEGGHADLAPGSHLEAELWGLLLETFGHVSWETVLCGPGLQHLYAAMCMLWGARAEALTPEQISSRGAAVTDPVCHQTLETFCGLLGSVAGNLALTVAAVGGVYIGGGIVPQMLDFVVSSPLRRRFEERGAMRQFVEDIPLLVITEHNPGLRAAAHWLAQRSR